MNTLKYYISLVFIVIFCIFDAFSILGVFACIGESVGALIMMVLFASAFLFVTVKCYKWHKRFIPDAKQKKEKNQTCIEDDALEDADEPLWVSSSGKESNFKPNYEIIYKDAEGRVSKRKIAVIGFDGRLVEAYCFLRNERRSFYVPRIAECVDLSTGEVINDDLSIYFAKMFGVKS